MNEIIKNIIMEKYKECIDAHYAGYKTIYMKIDNTNRQAEAIIQCESRKVCLEFEHDHWYFDKVILSWK